MNSQDQGASQSTNEQSTVVSTGDEGANQSQWTTWNTEETVSHEEYKKLQAEYTKSRQELSEFKKTSELSDDDKQAVDFLKKNNFLTRDDLDKAVAQQANDSHLNTIIANNPDLQQYEVAIKELAKSTWTAPEDIIEKYGFKSKDKLARAKAQWDVKWSPSDKPKAIADMSMDEYAKWKKDKWFWNNRSSFI